MRLVKTLPDQTKALKLSTFLSSEGIENQLEIITNTDWGSEKYGDVICHLWIIDEMQVEKANDWIEQFEKDPTNEKFQKEIGQVSPYIKENISTENREFDNWDENLKANTPNEINDKIKNQNYTQRLKEGKSKQQASLTVYIITLCFVLFIGDFFTAPKISEVNPHLPLTPQMASPIKKAFLYDYPKAYEIVDRLIKLYGEHTLATSDNLINALPEEGKALFQEFNKTPYWQGIYSYFLKENIPSQSNLPPLFEKIKQGQIYRTITPCFLHFDLLHIIFNMLWLFLLGVQIEERLKTFRYIILMGLIGVFSNTCQYLMSGAEFIGYSGIICGLLTFIWMRQKIAPWEGYPLQKSTINFLLFFIVAMGALQAFSFYLEMNHQMSISPGIANTAHLTGALFGACLGLIPLFKRKA